MWILILARSSSSPHPVDARSSVALRCVGMGDREKCYRINARLVNNIEIFHRWRRAVREKNRAFIDSKYAAAPRSAARREYIFHVKRIKGGPKHTARKGNSSPARELKNKIAPRYDSSRALVAAFEKVMHARCRGRYAEYH